MTNAEPQPFDFRENAALDDTAVALKSWIAKSSSFFSDFWSKASEYDAQLTLGQATTHSYSSILDTVSREDLCCTADIVDQSRSVWYASPKDLRIISAEMLDIAGDQDADDEEDLSLTAVEMSVISLFIENLAEALGRGWMGGSPMEIKPSELEKDPRKISVCRASDLVTKAGINVVLKSGTATINWILPKFRMGRLLESIVDRRRQSEPRKASEAVVETIPIQLVARLGQAKIPVQDLPKLAEGNLIILDQRIDRPIPVLLNDTPYYQCWPGQVGRQQAVEVDKQLCEVTTGEGDQA